MREHVDWTVFISADLDDISHLQFSHVLLLSILKLNQGETREAVTRRPLDIHTSYGHSTPLAQQHTAAVPFVKGGQYPSVPPWPVVAAGVVGVAGGVVVVVGLVVADIANRNNKKTWNNSQKGNQ